MKKLLLVLMLTIPCLGFSQEWADDSNIEDIISGKSAFGEDEPLVIVEFWAKFNDANAFSDWESINIPYVRVDIAKSPEAKKKYRVRMAPTIILFNEGFKEISLLFAGNPKTNLFYLSHLLLNNQYIALDF